MKSVVDSKGHKWITQTSKQLIVFRSAHAPKTVWVSFSFVGDDSPYVQLHVPLKISLVKELEEHAVGWYNNK